MVLDKMGSLSGLAHIVLSPLWPGLGLRHGENVDEFFYNTTEEIDTLGMGIERLSNVYLIG